MKNMIAILSLLTISSTVFAQTEVVKCTSVSGNNAKLEIVVNRDAQAGTAKIQALFTDENRQSITLHQDSVPNDNPSLEQTSKVRAFVLRSEETVHNEREGFITKTAVAVLTARYYSTDAMLSMNGNVYFLICQ